MLLITGGAGFIGSHAVRHFSKQGDEIIVIDNLSREMSKKRVKRIQEQVKFFNCDIKDFSALCDIFKTYKITKILHLAGQVSVVDSLTNPRTDFISNALGTFNILECLRLFAPDCKLIHASSNKVYGELSGVKLERNENGYLPIDPDFRAGIADNFTIEPFTPYSVSKIAADFLIQDYAKTYGLNAVSLRQSCIYGDNQHGEEGQGWVSWFVHAISNDIPLTLFGDGYQIRDILFIDDLIALYHAIFQSTQNDKAKTAFNVGGGIENQISLLGLINKIEGSLGKKAVVHFEDFRLGDQKFFVSSNAIATGDYGWKPKVSIEQGIKRLIKEYL